MGVPAIGRQLVVWTTGLEHLHDVVVLSLIRDHHRGTVEVIEESRVSKHIEKMLHAFRSSLPAGEEQGSLALHEKREINVS